LPADSGPDGPVAIRQQGRGLLGWLGQTFLSLWAGDSGDNGQLIDPLPLPLSEQGRIEELKRLAAELMAVFSAREVHREATAALVLFQRACEEERVTAELIARLATLLRRKG
jgi:hypothetical protein